LEAG